MKHPLPADKKGIEIRPGDVLKVFHFVGARNKQHYMYKVVHQIDGYLYAAHAHTIYLEGLSLKNSFALPRDGGRLDDFEIVEGFNGCHFEERVKRKTEGSDNE